MSELGQKAKYSERAHDFRSCLNNGHRQTTPVGPFRANKPDSHALFDHLVGGREGVSYPSRLYGRPLRAGLS
jgi:hypothetical protein